jgi:geranylgeranyl diphosphate synthase type I
VSADDHSRPWDTEDLCARVNKALGAFLDRQGPPLEAVSEDLEPAVHAIRDFVLDGGKRLRPAFAYWGWRGAGGDDGDTIVATVASLELLHACALIHDDVMDGSDTRRGQPAVHRRFAAVHRGERWHGSPDGFGLSAAILLGDMCLVWADCMLHSAGMPDDAVLRARRVLDEMRVELMAGQYLDVLEQARGAASVEAALRVARFKSAKYTVERPLHLGAALADAPVSLTDTYSAYGLPLGEAFQLRDDVLGVFGDPSVTGKPAGDDLREGKRTVLVATALERATPAQTAVVNRLLGDPRLDLAGVDRLREVIVETGALDSVEQLISRLTAQALAALGTGEVAEPARSVLHDLAVAATARRV